MRLDLSAPDYTTLSRRSQHLRRRLRPVPPGEGLHLVLDSTGLSIRFLMPGCAACHACARPDTSFFDRKHSGCSPQSQCDTIHRTVRAQFKSGSMGVDVDVGQADL